MTTIESNAFVLMIIFVIYAFVIGIYNIAYESLFRMRKQISYKTFNLMVGMYDNKVNYTNIVLMASVIFISIILFAIFIGSAVVRIYSFCFIPIDAVMGIFIYFELTRPKYNNNAIWTFNEYYRDVVRVGKAKDKLLDKIKELESQFDLEAGKLTNSLYKFNALAPNATKYEELLKIVNEKKLEFKKSRDELSNYNTSVVNQFNESISEYVIQGLSPEFEIQEYQHIDVSQMKVYISEVKQAYDSYVKDYLVSKVLAGYFKRSDKLIECFEIARTFNVKYEKEQVMAMLEQIDKSVYDKNLVAEYFFNQKIVPEEVLYNEILDRDWDWCFNEKTVLNLTRKQLVKAYQCILEKNAMNCCNALMKLATVEQADVIDRVLNTVTVNNACAQSMRFHKIMISNIQEFDDEVTKYEDMAIALKLSMAKGPNNSTKSYINQICNDESYYENREDVAKLYDAAINKLKIKYSKLITILMYYYDGTLASNKYVDNVKLMNYYMENMMTLNDNGLRYLNLLLCAVLMMYEKDVHKKKIAADSIKRDELTKDIDLNNMSNAEISGKVLVKKLLSDRMAMIVPIVNRTEKERLSLDTLKSIV